MSTGMVSRVPVRGVRPSLPDRVPWWMRRQGHVLLAVVGAAAFVIVRPAVADLQAADARAAAAARGVGPSYWLSWYAGTSPGDYSILTPGLTAALGVASTAAISVIVMALLARPLLAGTRRPEGAAYLLVASALTNLWSGRVPFSIGAACALAGLLALLRRRPWLGGALAGLAAVFSPLAPALLLLGLSGVALTRPERRADLLRFAVLTAVGLAAPTIAFGMPGPMPFPATSLAWTIGILLAVLCLPAPRPVRVSLAVAVVVALLLFAVPNGVGANLGRYAYLVVPPLVFALSEARTRVVFLALVPALSYSGFNVVRDQVAAAHPAARQSFYLGLRQELLSLPGIANHRVEVIDTATHRAAVELVPGVYLARGWEDQSDTTANPIFYQKGALTAANYQRWLEGSAVAWVAVPSEPATQNLPEARLATGGLPYLREIWHDAQWRLYAVAHPQPIVSAPAALVSADETTLVVDVPKPATVTFRIHPSRYLQLLGPGTPPTRVCLTAAGSAVQARIYVPGRYRLEAPFTVAKMLGDGC